VGNPLPEGTPASALADQFEKALGADDVSVMRSLAGAGVSIAARVPLKSRSLVESTVAAFAAEIAKLGIEASASVRPVTERVSSNVYAMAANEVVEIRVQAEGRTDEEIEEQIRSQLAAAGFLNPTVDVKMGDGQFEVEMMVSKECDDQICPPLELVIDGEQCCGEGPNEQMIELQIDARGKTPDQIKEEIEAQLAQRGIDKAKIRVHLDENGQARVEVESCGDSPQTSPKSPGLEKESWGELKEQNR
jgi:hypothetical protein